MNRVLIAALLLAAVSLSAQTFPNGVAAGDVKSDSVVLWARSTVAGDVRFLVYARDSWPPVIHIRRVSVSDVTVPAKVEVSGLRAGQEYGYIVYASNGESMRGQFVTPAAPNEQRGLHFGVSGDWRGELAPYPSVTNASTANLDFFVEFGDTIYADYPTPAVPKAQATTLAEFRAKHAEVYTAHNGLNSLADLRRSTAVFAVIDDHEVTNDFAGGAPPASDPRFASESGAFINETPLFASGMRAFNEYNPIREEHYSASPDARLAGKLRLYRYRTFGKDAAMFVLDARSFRDRELAAANIGSAADVGRFLLQSFDIDPATGKPTATKRTMLGQQQLADLKRDLTDAQSKGITWKFVLVPEPIQNLGPAFGEDRYEGYARERSEVVGYVAANGISNVVFVSADVHGTLINNVTYSLGPLKPQIQTGAFEIVTGAVAYDAPFGPTIVELAQALHLLDAKSVAFYNSLPIKPDADDTPNDKDDFVKSVVNQQLAPLGYDLLGLAGSPIDATLLQGDYIAVHTYGWTEFEIDQRTQKLTLTTWGVPAYTQAQMQAGAASILAVKPAIVSKFTVTPR